jgi:hypothetical protein
VLVSARGVLVGGLAVVMSGSGVLLRLFMIPVVVMVSGLPVMMGGRLMMGRRLMMVVTGRMLGAHRTFLLGCSFEWMAAGSTRPAGGCALIIGTPPPNTSDNAEEK